MNTTIVAETAVVALGVVAAFPHFNTLVTKLKTSPPKKGNAGKTATADTDGASVKPPPAAPSAIPLRETG